MRAEDVPEEYLDALISQLPAKATAGIAEIEFRAAIAAVYPLIAKAERERCARVAEVCPVPKVTVSSGQVIWQASSPSDYPEAIAAAIRALPDE